MPRTLNPKPKTNTKRITFHVTMDMARTLEKAASEGNENVSLIIRAALEKYFNIEMQREDTEFLAGIVRPIIRDEIGSQANRLAAMLFKIGVIAAGNYFLAVRTLADVICPSMQEDVKDINANARKQGIDYMKMNGIGVIEFLEDRDKVEWAAEKIKTDFKRGYRY